MDRTRACELLEVAPTAGIADFEAQRRWKRRQIEEALLTAGNDVLKRQYQDALSELELAFQVAVGDDARHAPGLSVTRMRDRPGAKVFYAEQRPGESLRVGITTGDVLGNRYEVRHLLGAGGTGAVFEGFDRTLKQAVALKIYLPSLFPDTAARTKFIESQRAVQKVVHPNVLKVFDVGESGSFIYVVTRLDLEPSLVEFAAERRAANNPLSFLEVQAIVGLIIDGLVAAGAVHHGYLHPESIRCTRTGQPRLSDFGATLFLTPAEITKLGRVMGTLPFLAPERLQDGVEVEACAASQYSLGVIAYELITGRRATARLEPLREVAPKCPKILVDCVEKLLEPSPADRYLDYSALSAAWRSSVGKVGSNSGAESKKKALTSETKISAPRNRPLEICLALLVLAILVVLWRIARME